MKTWVTLATKRDYKSETNENKMANKHRGNPLGFPSTPYAKLKPFLLLPLAFDSLSLSQPKI